MGNIVKLQGGCTLVSQANGRGSYNRTDFTESIGGDGTLT